MTRASPPIVEVALESPRFAASHIGHTLEELLRSGAVLEPAEVARIGVELGCAMASAHAAGRRPSGLTARDVDATLYAAPETLRGEHVTEQSDVYSVGVVLYRLLTGAFPVSAHAVQHGRHVDAWNTRDDLRGSGSHVPLPLAHIVERAIDPRPEARYATLEALGADLQEAARDLRVPDGPVRRRLRQGAGLVAVLALAALAWVVAHAPLDPAVVAVRLEHQAGSLDGRAIVDGMTIEMTRLLAQAKGLDVRAALPSSLDRYTRGDAVEFGAQRRASFVVSGSVHGDAGAWRHIEASLVRVRDAKTVWSDTLSFVDGDVFGVQERIAAAVAGALQVQFGSGRRVYSTTPPLQEEYLRARALQATGVDVARQHAAEIFGRVVRADPEFVPASAALATTLGGIRSGSPDLPALDPGTAAAARRAHAKDPHLAESNAAMGLLSARLCHWGQGRAYFREALKRDPSVTDTYIDYAISILLPLRDTGEAIDVLTTALEADAMSLRVRRTLAHVLVEHGENGQAIEISRSAIQETSELDAARQTLGRALYLSGRVSEAAEVFGTWESQWGYRGYILAVQGHHGKARVVADAHPDEPARQMLIYAGLKDVDRTFDALQRTARLNPWRALTWMARPEIEPILRGNARAAALRGELHRPGGCGGDHVPGPSPDHPARRP